MLKLDTRAKRAAATEIARHHTKAELTRILEFCPADVAELVRAHVERNGYRSGPAPLVPHRSFPVPRASRAASGCS